MLTFFLCLIFSDVKPIKVVVNNNRESKMIVQDFEIKWQEKSKSGTAKRLQEIQDGIKSRIEFIDITSLDSKVLKYSRWDKYPVILYGEYGVEPDNLPEEAYFVRSYPLLSMETYINKIEFDSQKYVKDCIDAEQIASNKYEAWLMDNKPAELADFFNNYYQEEISIYPLVFDFKKKFDNMPGIPTFRPNYPERPRIWYPWEKKYLLYKSYDKCEVIE